jgi:hypothetical protein
MRTNAPNHDRLRLFYKRQGFPAWGAQYVPAMRATVQEAPNISWASAIYSSRVGREIQTFSLGELALTVLAMLNPNLLDIQEARVLPTEPASGPLFGSPYDPPIDVLPLEGTVQVADRLNLLHLHPRVKIPKDAPGAGSMSAYPYLGDLLLYLKDKEGPYCVNWNVKQNEADFQRPSIGSLKKRTCSKAAEGEAARHLIEQELYLSGGIPTIQIASGDLHKVLVSNLKMLADAQARSIDWTSDAIRDLRTRLRMAFDTQIPPQEVITDVVCRYRIRPDLCTRVMHRMIWDRELCVDLYRPLLEDHPLRPATREPLVEHQAWFRRQA